MTLKRARGSVLGGGSGGGAVGAAAATGFAGSSSGSGGTGANDVVLEMGGPKNDEPPGSGFETLGCQLVLAADGAGAGAELVAARQPMRMMGTGPMPKPRHRGP